MIGLLVAAHALSCPAGAAPAGPTVLLDRTQAQLGQRVTVTLAGWQAHNVNLAVCGNLARRGTADCNIIASQDVKLENGTAPTLTNLAIFAPPAPCPCVVRAASLDQVEVAFVPVELVGVPVGPVVGPATEAPINVSVTVRSDPKGILAGLRSTLGGPTSYRVTVSVRNVSAEGISTVSVSGSAGRTGTDTAASFDFPEPGAIEPGKTWEHEIHITLAAPLLSRAAWRVFASGAGAPAEATASTHRTPVGFLLISAALGVDIVAMAWYFSRRRRARRVGEGDGVTPDDVNLLLDALTAAHPAA